MSIGKNIAKYRKAAGLTQEELGAKLGVTNQAVSKWESEVSMPDILLLPKIADTLGITLEDIYGIANKQKQGSVSADAFPLLCQEECIRFFYHNTKMRFTCTGPSDREQLDFLTQKLADGCRIGCISNTQGAAVITGDFSFIDTTYKAANSENIIKSIAGNILSCFSVESFQKAFSYQYKTAFERSKTSNPGFTFDEIMNGCNLSREETQTALYLLRATNINEIDIDKKAGTEKYVFLISNALYAHAIYALAELLSEGGREACWTVVRDTSMISDYAF